MCEPVPSHPLIESLTGRPPPILLSFSHLVYTSPPFLLLPFGRVYVDKIASLLGPSLRLDCGVQSVTCLKDSETGRVRVVDQKGQQEDYDEVRVSYVELEVEGVEAGKWARVLRERRRSSRGGEKRSEHEGRQT